MGTLPKLYELGQVVTVNGKMYRVGETPEGKLRWYLVKNTSPRRKVSPRRRVSSSRRRVSLSVARN